jgi:pyruvate/2-oxoglutarate dehydrogenase complex dihydrolipoamide dehydrogenase (E3) component
MPSKTLIYAAEVLHLARNAGKFGLNVKGASANMRSMHARKNRLISDFARHRVKELESGNFDLIRSNARFADSHTVVLDDGRRVRAEQFLISTGSRVSVPAVHGLSESSFWTSDDVLDLDFIPRSVVVLGGGIVACELAQFLNRIGTRVCIVQRNRALMRHLPVKASKVARQAFEDEGIEVRTRTRILGIRSHAGGTTVTFEQDGKIHRRKADHLLNALGREANTFGLSLGDAGVKCAPDGRIITNRWQQTTVPNIYAAGDCCGPHEIVHIAVQQGELAARHAAKAKGLNPIDDSMLLVVVFTDPQLATIGWQEHELKRKRIKYVSATFPFDDHGKAILMNATYGYVRVLASPRGGRILGAEIVGRDAGEMIHCFTTPLAMRATVHDMLRAPWYHPTLAEIITYPLEELAERTSL